MIRLFIEITDANDYFGIGAPVKKTHRSIDIEHPEIERLLAGNPKAHVLATLVGAEIITAPPPDTAPCPHTYTHHEGSLGEFCNACGRPVND